MPTPEYMRTRPEDTEALQKLDRSGATAQEFIEYQDNLSMRIVDGGGRSNEANFLRAFWPQLQHPSDGYSGGSPSEVSGAVSFARFLQRKEHFVVAKTNTDEHPSLPRVQIDQFGLLLGTGYPESPVVSYSIEECDDAPPEDEVLGDDSTYFLGRISIKTLWTPDTATARRAEDIVRKQITREHTILEIERSMGESAVDMETQHTNPRELGLIIGGKDIVAAIQGYALASERILDQSQRALHSAIFTLANKRS